MTKTISIFILASAALHAAVLGLVNFQQPTQILAGSPFRVSIQASSPSSGEKASGIKELRTKPVTENSSNSSRPKLVEKSITPRLALPKQAKPLNKNHSQQKTVTVLLEAIDQSKNETAVTSQNKIASSASSHSMALSPKSASLLRVDLEQAFALHFHYPRLAIKRGWQGEIQIGLRISANGHLSRIRILQSSGYSLLDKAAVKSLNKVEALPSAIALLEGHTLDFILPVKYQLL